MVVYIVDNEIANGIVRSMEDYLRSEITRRGAIELIREYMDSGAVRCVMENEEVVKKVLDMDIECGYKLGRVDRGDAFLVIERKSDCMEDRVNCYRFWFIKKI